MNISAKGYLLNTLIYTIFVTSYESICGNVRNWSLHPNCEWSPILLALFCSTPRVTLLVVDICLRLNLSFFLLLLSTFVDCVNNSCFVLPNTSSHCAQSWLVSVLPSQSFFSLLRRGYVAEPRNLCSLFFSTRSTRRKVVSGSSLTFVVPVLVTASVLFGDPISFCSCFIH